MALLLQQASYALRERPVLFRYCATEVATSRHNILFQRYSPTLKSFLNTEDILTTDNEDTLHQVMGIISHPGTQYAYKFTVVFLELVQILTCRNIL